jgi:hypothetical protein
LTFGDSSIFAGGFFESFDADFFAGWFFGGGGDSSFAACLPLEVDLTVSFLVSS